jgi:hypothetical protein
MMAVDKFYEAPANPLASMLGRVSLEATIARFNEQVAQYTPDVIRKRLKNRLGEVQVHISNQAEDPSE